MKPKTMMFLVWSVVLAMFSFHTGVFFAGIKKEVAVATAKPAMVLDRLDVEDRNDGYELFFDRTTGLVYNVDVRKKKEKSICK